MENQQLLNKASNMFLQDAGRKEVIDFFAENGIEGQEAETMATQAYMAVKEQRKEILKEDFEEQAQGGGGGVMSIVIGAILIIVGVALTMNSNSIYYGAIGVGAITLLQGIFARSSG